MSAPQSPQQYSPVKRMMLEAQLKRRNGRKGPPRSEFDRWVMETGLKGTEIAWIFKTCTNQISRYRAGVAKPSTAMRMIMTMMAEGKEPPPMWPE